MSSASGVLIGTIVVINIEVMFFFVLFAEDANAFIKGKKYKGCVIDI